MSRHLLVIASTIVVSSCYGGWTGSNQTLSAGDLTREYSRSKTAARDRYDGQVLNVRGCATVEPKMPATGVSEGLVVLGETGGDGHSTVNCWFTRKEAEAFAQIDSGRCLTVEGVFSGEMGTELRFCRLVKAE